MGLIDSLQTRGVLENPNVPLSDPRVLEMLETGQPTQSGASVNEKTSLQVSAYFSGVRFLSRVIGSLPLKLMRSVGNGAIPAREHPAYRIWHDVANPEMDAHILRETLQGHLLTWGNAYCEIVRDGAGRVSAAWPLLPDRTQRRYEGGLHFTTRINGDIIKLPPDKVMHVRAFGGDGRYGYSVVQLARESLGLSVAAEHTAASFYGNGMLPSGVLVHPGQISAPTQERLERFATSQAGGLTNKQRLLVLEGGMEYTQIGIPPGDAQFLESRQFQVREIARWLGVQPHILGDLEDATYSNIEAQGLELVTYSLNPWFSRWEKALYTNWLTRAEQNELYWHFEDKGLLRGDSEKRGTYFRERFNTASMTPNEIRAVEDENPIDGGDTLFVNAAMIPMDQALAMPVDERAKLIAAAKGVPSEAAPVMRHDSAEPGATGKADTAHDGAAFRPLLVDAWLRLCRGEAKDVRRRARKGEQVAAYYAERFYDYASGVLGPVAEAMRLDLPDLLPAYIADSLDQLEDASAGQIETLLDGWDARAEKWADRCLSLS